MTKTIVVLNDGTDEIFNLHSFEVKSKAQVYMDWGNMFITSGGLLDIFEEEGYKYQGCKDENQCEAIYFDLFTWIVDHDAEGRCFFLITEEPIETVEKKIDNQEELYSKTGGYEYHEDEFQLSWKQVKEALNWN